MTDEPIWRRDFPLTSAGEDETSLVLRHGLTTRSKEARAALRNGRVPTKVRMLIAEATRQWTVTLDGASKNAK